MRNDELLTPQALAKVKNAEIKAFEDFFLGKPRQTIIRNQAECLRCGNHICSFGRHSYITCDCGTVSVDGGRDYLRRAGDLQHCRETSIVVPDDIRDTESRQILVYLKAFDAWFGRGPLTTREIVQGAASVMYEEEQKWNRRPLDLKGSTDLDTERLCSKKLEKMEEWGLLRFEVESHRRLWRRLVELAPPE